MSASHPLGPPSSSSAPGAEGKAPRWSSAVPGAKRTLRMGALCHNRGAMKVLKFGGTSVGTPAAIRQVVAIVRQSLETSPAAVVVSAFAGVTNQLLALAAAAARREEGWEESFGRLRERHLAAARELAGDGAAALAQKLESLFSELHELLRGVYLLREASPRALDGIASYGERCSAEVVAAAFEATGTPARALDTRFLVLTDAAFGKARVEIEPSYENLRRAILGDPRLAVATGFIGGTAEGFTTTLGRGGSDYSGALVAAALGAAALEIWTDVSGVLSADPRVVAAAFPQPEMSYAELMELSHFGAKVIYPPSIHPARALGIPLHIKNTFAPEHPGTVVFDGARASAAPIRGISSIDQVALARLEGDGMIGVPGIAERLFGALAREKVSVILISQSSSEHSICFAVAPEDAAKARAAVAEEFALELRLGLVEPLVVESGQSVVAAVGAGMARQPGIAGRVFGVLGENGVNVRAIAQGSSELNISLVVPAEEAKRAVGAIHAAFFLPGRRRLDLALAGVGKVGAELLAQIAAAAPRLAAEGLELRVVAIASSRRLLRDENGLDLGSWRAALESAPAGGAAGLRQLFARKRGARRVFADCTGDAGLGELYPLLLEAGVAVVAANKKPFAGPLQLYRRHQEAAAAGNAPLYFEATAGAGLPILSTLRDLVATGDRVLRIDGVLSGTANAVFSEVGRGMSLSAAVEKAHAAGLTEPHPYEDLAGADVMRKLCILGRLAGLALEPDDVAVEPIVPEDPFGRLPLEQFWQQLPAADAALASRREAAAEAGLRLRYLASIDLEAGEAIVSIAALPPEHPAYSLDGPDNMVAFKTRRYHRSPLVVRGPGAGPEVTAAGVFADILRTVREGQP
jgi:aspartokinase/homoserine dehydrogenase 1